MARGGQSEPVAQFNPVEAEQSVLGILLWDGGDEKPIATGLLPPELTAADFYEPFHGRMFARWQQAMAAGRKFEPVAAGAAFENDPAFQELGGIRYFADLVDRAPPRENVAHYAKIVIEGATRRRLVHFARAVTEAVQDLDTPVETLLGEIQGELAGISTAASSEELVDADTAMDGVLDYIDNPGAHPEGVTAGLAPIDRNLGPWLPGDLIGLAARPGAGKSAIAAVISRNVAAPRTDASTPKGVIEFHGEMAVAQVWRRRLTGTAYELFAEQAPTYSAIRKREIEFAQREALGRAREMLRGIPLKAVSRPNMRLARIRAIIERQRLAWERQGIELGLVVIDHAGHVKPDKDYRTRIDEQSAVSGGLKAMALDLKIPILALLQLSRGPESREDKHPLLPDLRDSGTWEQDLDICLGAYRDAYYARQEREPDDSTTKGAAAWAEWDARRRSPWIDIDFLKVREGGGSRVKLWANMGTNTILGAAPADDFFRGLI